MAVGFSKEKAQMALAKVIWCYCSKDSCFVLESYCGSCYSVAHERRIFFHVHCCCRRAESCCTFIVRYNHIV